MIASRLGMPAAEAEVLKCRVGLVRGEGVDSADVVEEAIRPLVSEIRSSFSYYASSHGAQRVARLALVGGAAQLPGLTEKLTQSLGVPAFLSDPLQRVSDSRRGGRHDVLGRFRAPRRPSRSVYVGSSLMTTLALPPADLARPASPRRTSSIVADLMPDEVLATRRLRDLKRKIFIGMAALVVVLLAAYRFSWLQT